MDDRHCESKQFVIMFTDLVGSTALKVKLGDREYLEDIARPHDEIYVHILSRFPGASQLKDTGDGFMAIFARVSDAVNAALLFHRQLHTFPWRYDKPQTRIGIHVGEAMETEDKDIKGHAPDMCARVMGLAEGGQTLLTGAAFDDARQFVRKHPSVEPGVDPPNLEWLAHGRYMLAGKDESREIFEVGAVGLAPLKAPDDSEKAKRAGSIEEQQTLGWRPATGLEIPGRKHWIVERKLGEGSFGEVWLARHKKTGQPRVFKFCFDCDRLRSFRRELTLFKLIREKLGERKDVVPLLEVQLDQSPFFLESEHVPGGNLKHWAEKRGGIASVPLATRLDLITAVAHTLAAAHSVKIVHKDVKPSNILIREETDGNPIPVLADFGIGAITDMSAFADANLTASGFTESLVDVSTSRTGTWLYAPPGAKTGKEEPTPAWDVYSLGVLLYQLIVADFDRPLAIGWEREVEDGALRGTIHAAAEGDPARRLQSATAFVAKLERVANTKKTKRVRQRWLLDVMKAETQFGRLGCVLQLTLGFAFILVSVFFLANRGMFFALNRNGGENTKSPPVPETDGRGPISVAPECDVQPILEYRFNERGTSAPSTGSDPTKVTFFLPADSETSFDLHTADTSGLSGLKGDSAFHNIIANKQGAFSRGAVARHKADANSIDGLTSFTLTGWLMPGSTIDGNAAIFFNQDSASSPDRGFSLSAGPAGCLELEIGSNVVTSDASYTDTGWFFFAVSFDGSLDSKNVAFHKGTTKSSVIRVGTPHTIQIKKVDDETQIFALGNYTAPASNSSFPGNGPIDSVFDNMRVFGSKTDNSGVLTQDQLECIRQRDVVNLPLSDP